MRIENGETLIRDFADSDLPLMYKWLTDDRVLEYYEGRDVRFTMDTLADHYGAAWSLILRKNTR